MIESHFLPYAEVCGFTSVTAAGAYGWLSGIYAIRSLRFMLLIQVGNDLSLRYLFSAVFGLLDYATAPVVDNLVASHLGVRVMGLSMGLLGAGHALGAAIEALFGGIVFDSFGSYRGLWLMSIAMAVLAALVWAFIPTPVRQHGGVVCWPSGLRPIAQHLFPQLGVVDFAGLVLAGGYSV